MRVQSNIHTKNISPWILRRLVYNNFSYLQHLTSERGFQWGGGGGSKTQLQPDGQVHSGIKKNFVRVIAIL